MEIKNTRLYEAILVASAFVVYVVQRLFDEQAYTNQLFQAATRGRNFSETLLENWPRHDFNYHVIIPIVSSATLLLLAWLIFHLLLVPSIKKTQQDVNRTLLYSSLSIVFIVASLFVYYSFFQQIKSIMIISDEPDDGVLTTYHSLFRKKNILGDAIGIGFLFVFYELVSCTFQWWQKSFSGEKNNLSSVLACIIPFIPAAILLYLALGTQIPTPLWSGNIKLNLWWISCIVFVWAMQEYVVRFLIPNYKAPFKIFLSFLFLFIIIFIAGNILIWEADTNFYFYNYRSPFAARSFQKQLIRTLGPVLIIVVFRKIIFKEKTVLQQQVAGTSAELAQLRSQINPHFLFNAFNSLYAAAMKEGAEKAADGIQRLGDMMRFMLQENNQDRISVEKEIEYLHNYIHLQRIRIDETQGIDIKVVLNHPDNDVYIAPMMLIPFVENAFKHGISHRSVSFLFITLSFDATHLYFRVQNSKHTRHEADLEEYQSGIGLQNVQKRLQLLYPGRHTLQLQETDHDFHIFLTLSLW